MKTRKLIWVLLLTSIAFLLTCTTAFAQEQEQEQEISTTPEHGIPLVIVYVNETQSDIEKAKESDPDHEYGNIQEMNESERHSVRALGDLEIVIPEGYQGEYGSVAVPEGRVSLKYIRGRGNSTWAEVKKPYKIAFQEEQDLFGMGQCKDWALMANYLDNTLMRNRLTFWVGDHSSVKYSPRMVPVDLVMIGLKKDEDGNEQEVSRNYLGSYCLTETIEIGESRIGIDELKKKDVDQDIITGGYLLAIYSPAQDEGKVPVSSWFTTPSGLKITNEDPEFEDENLTEGRAAQRTYIRNYVNELDKLIMESEEITPQIHDQIAGMMDLESLADYWWIQEFSYNTDAFTTGSTYLYKPRNGKLFWGPLWDFDLAWSIGIGAEPGYVTGFSNTENTWVDMLREKDPQFLQLLKDRWNDGDNGIRKALLQVTDVSEGGILNRYAEEIRDSFAADKQRWPNEYDPEVVADFDKNKEELRFWINKRVEWIDANLDTLGTVHHTVTYETEDGTVIETKSVRDRARLSLAPGAPDKAGYIFTEWEEKATGEGHAGYIVVSDVTFIPHYISRSEAVEPTHLFLSCYEDWVEYPSEEGGVPEFYYMRDPIILPENADVGSVKWTSSDESILSFGNEVNPTINGTGDVDLTVTLWNGLSRTLHLHVYDPQEVECIDPESISFDPSSFTIKAGETIQVLPEYQPQGTPLTLMACLYESDDESTVQLVDEYNGIITGMKPGEATITTTVSDIADEVVLQASFQVKVAEQEKPQEPINISNAKVVLSKTSFTYNGKTHKPSIRSIGGKKLTEGRDYTVKWSNPSPKEVGEHALTITGKGNYTGTTKASFKINPKGTKITQLKKGRKSIAVKWKRQSAKMSATRIMGYQVQIATNKAFTKNKKTLKVKRYSTVSKKVKGLQGGKKYFVRIRTYKTIKGVNYYSTWSKARKVKVQ